MTDFNPRFHRDDPDGDGTRVGWPSLVVLVVVIGAIAAAVWWCL